MVTTDRVTVAVAVIVSNKKLVSFLVTWVVEIAYTRLVEYARAVLVSMV